MLSIFRTYRLFTILALYGLIVSGAAPAARDWCERMEMPAQESAPCHGDDATHEADSKEDATAPRPENCCCELGVATDVSAVPVVTPTGKDTYSSRVAILPGTPHDLLRSIASPVGCSPDIVPPPFHSHARQAYLCSFLN